MRYTPDMTLNLRIREMREARGWSLAKMADMIGVSAPHLSQVERGEKNINNHLIENISRVLNVKPHELFAPQQRQDALYKLLSSLSDDDLARVEQFARALAATGR